MTFDEILELDPYSLDKQAKQDLLDARLCDLTKHHYEKCKKYRDILDAMGVVPDSVRSYKDIPFLPVRLFKELELKSVEDDEIVKTMTSSGTTGQRVSKIFLDRTTSANQQKTMVKIVNDYTGSNRMPMIILDCPSVVKDRAMFSARGAGILGFSIFGSKRIYALDDEMKLNVDELRSFLEANKGKTILLFGFTFMVWQYFYKELVRLKKQGVEFDLSDGVLIHGGGWKKLVNEAVSPQEFHDMLHDVCGLDRIHDYYGMVEQTGCIYMQCECGHLHASIFSDVIVRDPHDFRECEVGERGLLQVVSTIPESYPGHSLLTEDEGIILGEDDCPCGRKGKYFKILGRIKNAELRGCSDTFAVEHSTSGVTDNVENSLLKKVQFQVGDGAILSNMSSLAPLAPFDGRVIAFLSALSREFMNDREAKAFPDIVTLGFWLRKASLERLAKRFMSDETSRVGRGIAFHIAPSNVPVNYAYSLFSGLMSGNANIVRIPSKDFPQVSIINRVINKVLDEHQEIRPYICLIKYDRDKEVNDHLSQLCDVRIIWGGDNTIAELRKSPIGPRATEITFADRYSLAMINSDEYLLAENKERIAMDFYNDTYLSDQNACTSPRLVAWLGNQQEQAQELFWSNLHRIVSEKYRFQSIQSVDKLSVEMLAAASEITDMSIQEHEDNLLVRVKVKNASSKLMDYRGNSGFFYEVDCHDALELREFCNNTHCQTVVMYANRDAIDSLLRSGLKGVDRVVPIGHSMDFDLLWDGYDLLERLTRTISIM